MAPLYRDAGSDGEHVEGRNQSSMRLALSRASCIFETTEFGRLSTNQGSSTHDSSFGNLGVRKTDVATAAQSSDDVQVTVAYVERPLPMTQF